MSAAASVSRGLAPRPPVVRQRDDGPLARALGRLGRDLPVEPAVATAFAALPMAALAAARGEGASDLGAAIALGWLVAVGGLAAGRPHTDAYRWAVPPLLRAAEYAALLWVGALGDALPAAFAVLAVLWFHHYGLVYRDRHQGAGPPRWVGDLAGGWEGRLVGAWLLLVLGALPAGFYAYAVLLAVLLVGETVVSWRRRGLRRHAAGYEEAEDEGQ